MTTPVALTRARSRPSHQPLRHAAAWCYLFVLPGLALAVLFTFWPLAAAWYYSFQEWSGFTKDMDFVGLANYVRLIMDAQFWNAFAHSFLFMIVTVPVRLVLALVLAIVLNDRLFRMATFFRTVFFLPVVTTTAIVGLVMTFVLDPSSGPVNHVLLALGVVDAPVGFLTDPHLAMPTVMATSVWKFFGISLVYWLAALQSIPAELYEAARIDGASGLRMHLTITAPLLKVYAVVIVVITAANTLRIFDLVQTMTGGGPYFATEVIEVYIYRTAFSVLGGGVPQLGLASAAGVFFGVTVMIIALLQVGATRRLAGLRNAVGAGQGR